MVVQQVTLQEYTGTNIVPVTIVLGKEFKLNKPCKFERMFSIYIQVGDTETGR